MANLKSFASRWGPALLWMGVLFVSSATPSSDLPTFGFLDFAVKKGGHMLGYAILAMAYRRALGRETSRPMAAWALAVMYALVDEFHQSFVPGRHPSLIDALVFDGGGAALAIWLPMGIARLRSRAPATSSPKTDPSRNHSPH
ncbi:MAG: VanZ family protein [Anaerolineales bacterium]